MVNTPTKLICHHTGGTNENPLADTSHHTFEMVDALHKSFGWGKIGYHYFIDKQGQIRQGRGDKEEGAHTKGQNTTSLGICLAGNFDATLPTPEQIKSLTTLLKKKCKEYLISEDQIFPHRRFSPKSCYGRKLSDTWARDLVKDKQEDQIQVLTLKLRILQLKLQIQKLLGL